MKELMTEENGSRAGKLLTRGSGTLPLDGHWLSEKYKKIYKNTPDVTIDAVKS